MNETPPPLVSVVTPCFNAAQHITATIESVLAQGYPAIEHIVIDGGSTDGTTEILRRYSHLQWISEKDRGQSDALNKGFRRATGEVIGWLNADDTYQPGAVGKAVRGLVSHPEVAWTYGDVEIIDGEGRKVGLAPSAPIDFEKLLLNNFVQQPAVFMRRQMIDSLGGVDERLHYTMDWELWLRAELNGFKSHYLSGEVLAGFRLTPGTKSYEAAPKFRGEWLDVLRRTFDTPALCQFPARRKEACLRSNLAQYHVDCMLKAIEDRNRGLMLRSAIAAVRNGPRLVANRGMWYLLMLGVLGKKFDRYRKYRKAAGKTN